MSSRDEQAQLEHVIDPGVVLKALKEERVVAADSHGKYPVLQSKEKGLTPSGFPVVSGSMKFCLLLTIKELMMAMAQGCDRKASAK